MLPSRLEKSLYEGLATVVKEKTGSSKWDVSSDAAVALGPAMSGVDGYGEIVRSRGTTVVWLASTAEVVELRIGAIGDISTVGFGVATAVEAIIGRGFPKRRGGVYW